MKTPDVVVLTPGFLGFSRFGGFYYFADRVVAAVRGLLEEALGRAVPVVPCSTLPTDSLASRQRFLLDFLETLCTKRLSGVDRVHLVGHSTGGVDAHLLTCAPRLDGKSWGRRDQTVRRRIASVVTISAPHHGTGLAESRLARFGENPLRHPGAIGPLSVTLLHLLELLPREMAATVGFQVACPNDVLKFLLQILRNRDLIADLRPASMARIRSAVAPDLGVPLTCFVTGTIPSGNSPRKSDPFFEDLYRMSAEGSDGTASPAVEACRSQLERALREHPELVIASASASAPLSVDLRLNDGIVNSARQLVDADDPAQLGGFVVADHGDVIGHYDRQDALIEGRPFNAGLFHSGAGFGDDQFFELYRRAADALLQTIPDRHVPQNARRSPSRSARPPSERNP